MKGALSKELVEKMVFLLFSENEDEQEQACQFFRPQVRWGLEERVGEDFYEILDHIYGQSPANFR